VKTNLLFFTKGRPTRRTWYYDLSGVRVGKKQPLTLAHFGFGRDGEVLDDAALPASLLQLLAEEAIEPHADPGPLPGTTDQEVGAPFPSFARLLPTRGTPAADSGLSWTLDIETRRDQARAAMAPHLAEAERRRAQAIHWRAKAAALRRDKTQGLELAATLAHLADAEREAREAQTRADAIDAAVFDLKAVNPRARGGQDSRSPEAVLTVIAAHQRTIDSALTRLAGLLTDSDLTGAAEGPIDQF
jgi:type I restriction enzyme M protein